MKDFYYPSAGFGMIHGCRWEPEGNPKAVVQIVHGIAEHVRRYDEFARYLSDRGVLVVAEDHMGHGESGDTQGYFHGGWFAAVEDSYRLLKDVREEFPDIPYILFGHSMGSFIVRTILQMYPQCGISGCIICGTGWLPGFVLNAGKLICKVVCAFGNEKKPSPVLQGIVFSGYNKKITKPQTAFDWLTNDEEIVNAYINDPKCGFVASAGLLRDMLVGMIHIQRKKNLNNMNKALPVHFVAGGADPVGNYGKGVEKTAKAFSQSGMRFVTSCIYPCGRHEILNEINRVDIYKDIAAWIDTHAIKRDLLDRKLRNI